MKIGAHLLDPAAPFSPLQVLEEHLVSAEWWGCGGPAEPRLFQPGREIPLPCRAALCPRERHHSRPRTPVTLIPRSPAASAALDNRAFIELCGRRPAGQTVPGAGAPAPRSLLDPADGLDLARLRVGPPLADVLVLARGAVALQEVLEAPVPRVLRAHPPAAERSAALARGRALRARPGSSRSIPRPCRCPGGAGRLQAPVLTLRSGRGRNPRCCCPSPGRAARGSRRSSLPACPGSFPLQRASTCSVRDPAAETGTALALPPPCVAGGLRGSRRGGGTHGAGDGAEGAHPLHAVSVAAAPRLPARVLASLQHELLPLEAAVLEACPPAGPGGVRPPRCPPPRSPPGCARRSQPCPREAARGAKGTGGLHPPTPLLPVGSHSTVGWQRPGTPTHAPLSILQERTVLKPCSRVL